MSSPAAPPTPQEVSRTLSLHAAASARAPRPEPPPLSPESPFAGLTPIAERARAESGEDDSDDEPDGPLPPPRAADAEDAVLKSGYLCKKGERRKSWKKRWFVLRTSHLAYYKTSAEYRLLRLLALADVHTCVPVTLKRHAHTFCLVSPARTFYLEAASAAEMAGWIRAVNAQRERVAASPRASVVGPGAAPIAIPGAGRASGSGHPPPVASSPGGYGFTTSDSDDAASVSPHVPALGRARSQSQSQLRGGGGVAFAPAPATPRVDWDPSKVVLSGYLMKCGKRRHWRKRWFMLTGEKLAYSGSHMDTKAHREIPLAEVLDTLEVELEHRAGPAPAADGTDPYGRHTFKIVTTTRTLLLCAPGEEEEIKWLSAVRALVARRDAPAAAGASSGLLRGKVRRLSQSGRGDEQARAYAPQQP